ncbi:CHAP domain-containing protein [Apibacter raozihei]|uniref:CHAP domain-containing protein n=1 Tax=Apibacter raozihei TaxID=2500547 RepID=UPI000FE34D2F|nr:CHAP domain-containing protein [Apibacter raozihei]
MKIVLDETKNYGGYDEGTEPLKSRIKNTYFTIKNEFTTNKTDPTKVSWCATFVSWCLQQAEYSNPSSCRALEFNPEYMHDGAGKPDRPSGMRKISNPVYGCIIVWKNNSGGGGHVAFHYGYTLSGNIVPIGGNQGNSLKFSNRSPKGDYGQKIVGYFLPEDYEDNPEDEFTEDEKKLSPTSLNSSSLLKTSSIEDDKGKTT